jgi:hypothetical protein
VLGLLNLLPSSVSLKQKEKYARKLKKTKETQYDPVKKNEVNSNIFQIVNNERGVNTKSVPRKIKRQCNNELDAKNRELAREGIVVHDRTFRRVGSFYGGRLRSLEWNDEIAVSSRRPNLGLKKMRREINKKYKLLERKD